VRFVTFGVTNHSDRSCIVRPVSVEVRHGSSWERCFEFPLPSGPVVSHLGTSQGGHIKSGQDLGPNPLLGPHEYCSSTLELKNLPLGSPLRLKVGVSKELPALEGLFRRLDLRFRRGVKGIPLNPFNKSSRLRLYSKEAPTVSEEFIEPDSNPVSQGNSER